MQLLALPHRRGAGAACGDVTPSRPSARPLTTMVDYSRWDNFGDDESSDDDATNAQPRVTKFDAPTSVSLRDGSIAAAPPRAAPRSVPTPVPAVSAELALSVLTQRGGRTSTHLWSQTDAECVVTVPVPIGTHSSAVRVALVVEKSAESASVRQRHCLRITLNGVVLAERQLAFPIVVPDGAEGLDWEIVDCAVDREELLEEPLGRAGSAAADEGAAEGAAEGPAVGSADDGSGAGGGAGPCRLLQLSLQKKVPVGIRLWWNRVFEGDAIVARNPRGSGESGGANAESGAAGGGIAATRSRNVWEEAHAMFREKVKGRTPVELHIE